MVPFKGKPRFYYNQAVACVRKMTAASEGSGRRGDRPGKGILTAEKGLTMNQEQSTGTRQLAFSTFSITLLAIALIWLVFGWQGISVNPAAAVAAGLVLFKWIGWIVLYFSLQFIVAVIIGRALKRATP